MICPFQIACGWGILALVLPSNLAACAKQAGSKHAAHALHAWLASSFCHLFEGQ
jgi:hypothetical protein